MVFQILLGCVLLKFQLYCGEESTTLKLTAFKLYDVVQDVEKNPLSIIITHSIK